MLIDDAVTPAGEDGGVPAGAWIGGLSAPLGAKTHSSDKHILKAVSLIDTIVT